MHPSAIVVTGLVAAHIAFAQPATQAPAGRVEDVVSRARSWVTAYTAQMPLVVGVEQYSQYMGGEGFSRAHQQRLMSEFALVVVNGDWQALRDVYEIDGKPVHEERDRLRKLFLESPGPPAIAQGRKYSDETARHNLGVMQRTFNVPTLALFFLQPSNADRFKFRKDGEDALDGRRVWKVRYEETLKPTLMRTGSGKDMPIKGTFWIDPGDGAVWRTHLEIAVDASMGGQPRTSTYDMDGGTVVRRVRSTASVRVDYKRDEALGHLVPDKMVETYEGPSVNRFTGNEEIMKINGWASYSGFRKVEGPGGPPAG